jgi:hypothetical protein
MNDSLEVEVVSNLERFAQQISGIEHGLTALIEKPSAQPQKKHEN